MNISEDKIIDEDYMTEYCSICGKVLLEGQKIYITEDGKYACSLTELLSELRGKEVC